MREIVKWVVDVYTSVCSFIFGEKQKENQAIFEPEKITLVFFDMDKEEEEMEKKTLTTFTSTKDGELFDREVSEARRTFKNLRGSRNSSKKDS